MSQIVVTCPRCGIDRIYVLKVGTGTILMGCKHCKRSFWLTVQNGVLQSVK